MIDIDSEMMNITRKASKCSSRKWLPKCPQCHTNDGIPCGQGVVAACKECDQKIKRGERCNDSFQKSGMKHMKDCFIPEEYTRDSNPPCNLRGTGWNRFEWLCLNPQDRIHEPYDFNIDTRIVIKDNHRPLVPKPIDDQPARPTGGEITCERTVSTCGAPTQEPSVQWRKCDQIAQY